MSTVIQTFTSSGTWTCPAGVAVITTVTYDSSSNIANFSNNQAVTPSTVYTITINFTGTLFNGNLVGTSNQSLQIVYDQ
jgi:hypothetical protein